MAALLIVIALVVLCVLGAVSGVDSRPVEVGGHRPNWS
jgi:hypothetical protein